MKALEVAKNNSVSFDDVQKICTELKINCKEQDAEITTNDAFLIKTRIETMKHEKAAELKKSMDNSGQKPKKIKLKKKVHIAINKANDKEGEEATGEAEETPIPATESVAAPEITPEKRSVPSQTSQTGQGGQGRDGQYQPRQGQGGQGRDGQYQPRQGQGGQGRDGQYQPRQGQGGQGRDGQYQPRQGQGGQGRDGQYQPRQGQGGQGRDGQYQPRQGQGGQGRDGQYQPRQGGGQGGQYQPRQGGGQGGQYQPRQGGGQGGPYQPRQGGGQGGPYQPRQGGGQGGPYQPRQGGQGGPGQGRDGQGNRPWGQRPGQSARPFTPRPDSSGIAPAETGLTEEEKRRKDKTKDRERDRDRESKKSKRVEKTDREANLSKVMQPRRKKGGAPVQIHREAVTPKEIDITESILVGDLAKKLNVKANEVIAKLIKLGVMATINQVLDAETAAILCSEYGTEVHVVSLYDETVIREEEEDLSEDNVHRPPIVTVMGHVDHGKTKLLDAIRSENVADGEFGGITQHIGAYQVKVKDQYVTFLDTPGHEAFTTMRARGASVTDIVVLVVAANDGVMPQTKEAIAHAKAANVPIIVAINKIDLPEANPEKVKQELTGYDLVPEEWGGTTLFAQISAKQKLNIDSLLELILIQAEMLELTANKKVRARGTVIESKLDPGRGAVATILVQNGTLHVGDPFVVGVYSGKVRAMFNDKGEAVLKAGPSMPVEVLGIDGIASAGDPFQQVATEKYSKQISQKRMELKRIENAHKNRKVSLEDINAMIKEGEIQEVRLIIKADVDGSVQALKDALEKLSTSEVRVKVIHFSAGGINESDVMLASASDALIIGYHVRPSTRIQDLAERENVSIKTYNIIFEVTADVKAAMEGMLSPEIKEEIVGSGEIKQVFKISKLGTVAGAVVLSGKLQRSNKIRLIRDDIVIYDGALKSLKRFKDDASEVEPGQECGFGLEKFNDLKTGDTFEAYRLVEITKKLEG